MSSLSPGRQVRRSTDNEPAVKESHPKERVRRAKQLKRIGVIALIIVITIVLIAQLRLNSIEVKGTSFKAEVTAAASSALKNQLFGSNVLLLRSGGVAHDINQIAGDRVASVRVSKDLWHRQLVITATDRQPAIAWQSAGKLYVVDQTGRITKEAAGRSNLPLVIDETNVSVAAQTQVVSPQFLQFVTDVQSKLQPALGASPKQYRVRTTTNDLLVDTSGGYYLVFDTTRPVGEQLDEAKRVIEAAKSKNQTIKNHIDVRLPYKAYYQ